ncbi:MAG: HEPN domain-containing protein [Leptolyngbyaceae cyanobacterium SM2_5_2]|nr:HEPN domain-containing protein [Leptolyngbyaceae cyanobacterium SM2_5_2]
MAADGLYEFAVARAYYTMFYIAEAFLLQANLSFSSHAGVIAGFGQYIAKPGLVPVEFHRYLIDAQDMRTRADYGVDTGLNLEDTDEQIVTAQKFIELAESSLS